MAVHPRGRGEHHHWQDAQNTSAGSSPRARGTPVVLLGRFLRLRFIPAGAGNTAGWRPPGLRLAVHPRGRGEHESSSSSSLILSGSSPRARGTQSTQRALLRRPRFIPAGAGNTLFEWFPLVVPTVHPRGRGEHISSFAAHKKLIGSSPRARGTHELARWESLPHRFIPAGAGNTSCRQTLRRLLPVHPRGRGEHNYSGCQRVAATGSSPRARGTRTSTLQNTTKKRFIPAGAGNTKTGRLPLTRMFHEADPEVADPAFSPF